MNEASKRAVFVSEQAMQGRSDISIAGFTNNAALGFRETVTHDAANKHFSLAITGIYDLKR